MVYEYSKCLAELLQVEPYDSAIARTAVRQMHRMYQLILLKNAIEMHLLGHFWITTSPK